MKNCFSMIVGLLVGVISAAAAVDPNTRTAALPDSWLVLYNINCSESVDWKEWYIQQWNIPVENALGLDVSTNEKIVRDSSCAEARVYIMADVADGDTIEIDTGGLNRIYEFDIGDGIDPNSDVIVDLGDSLSKWRAMSRFGAAVANDPCAPWEATYGGGDDFVLVIWPGHAGVTNSNSVDKNNSVEVTDFSNSPNFVDNIRTPVINYLDNNPGLKKRIMGIIVGYKVPGNFYKDAETPTLQGGGGYSVSSNLKNPMRTGRGFNPHSFSAYYVTKPRLTKATLTEGHYFTARLDGPTLDDVKALTIRAKAVSGSQSGLVNRGLLYYDYEDPNGPAGDEWISLKYSVHGVDPGDRDNTAQPTWRFPWCEFESGWQGSSFCETTPDCVLRFSYYRLSNWHNVSWAVDTGQLPGSRILDYSFNSWGATTVRNRTLHGGRFVPNALFNVDAPFVAAVGATGEPYSTSAPAPSTIVWCLSEGWTLGEAVYHACYYENWMWELVGDPLLAVPCWCSAPADLDDDCDVDQEDFGLFQVKLSGHGVLCAEGDEVADFDGDGDVDQTDFHIFYMCMAGPERPIPYDCFEYFGRFVPADLNADGYVNLEDLLEFSQKWLSGTEISADMYPDGMVNMSDFSVFAEYWLDSMK